MAGYDLSCNKCGHTVNISEWLGPHDTDEEIEEKICRGELGEEAKKFYEDHEGKPITVLHELFRCEKCDLISEEIYVIIADNDDEFVMHHTCKECGGNMTLVNMSIEGTDRIPCPKCHRGRLVMTGEFLWD
ncbi:hypothetical protein [Candidatus Methanomassiliicoccus intestinalis]|uniref:hypothetical protein n=1 Tax=Candidatus Methanomassiliicoccus intestinalis TaxID=1406512 RepID=UPI0037DC0EE5